METTAQDDLKAHLMATDAHYRELVAKHSEYDHKLHELESKNSLTEDEQLEEVHLKKLKLHLKDQMMDVLNRNKAQRVA